MPAGGRQGYADWVDFQSRQPLRDYPGGGERGEWRLTGARAGGSGKQRASAEVAGSCCLQIAGEAGRVHRVSAEVRYAAGGGHDIVTGRVEGIQSRAGGTWEVQR